MSAILFALEVTAVVLVVVWAYRNDHLTPGEGGTGLFAMRSRSNDKPLLKGRWRHDIRTGGRYARRADALKAAQPWRLRPPPRWR